MKYIIGIDVGTTAVKAAAYDLNNQELISASETYPLIQEIPGQAEEDPKVIFAAVQKVIYTITSELTGRLLAISWSSQMHSLIGLDREDHLVTNSYTWADNRAQSVVTEYKNNQLADKIYQRTGMPIHPMAPIYKLLWLKKTNNDLYQRVDKWMGIKEYLIYRLTGEFVQDIPLAAGSGMLNLNSLQWDQEILKKLALTDEQLPKLVKPATIISNFNEKYLKKLNLTKDTITVVGASDGYLSTIGVGVLDDQNMAINVGTSGAARVITKNSLIDKQVRNFCYPIEKNSYLIGAPVNNGGIVFDWARRTILGPNSSVSEMLDLAKKSVAGSYGLIFHPYLAGERAPVWDADAKGSFVGLTSNNTKAQMVRSVIEGIILNLYLAAEGILTEFDQIARLKVTGGFMQSDFIKQLTANIFNLPVASVNNSQSGTFAAMFLARISLGLSQNFDEIGQIVREEQVFYPQAQEVKVYQDLLPIYREITEDLRKNYRKITEFQLKYSFT